MQCLLFFIFSYFVFLAEIIAFIRGIFIVSIIRFILKFGYNWNSVQNGTTEEVKKIVTTLNEAEIPSEDVVGMDMILMDLVYMFYLIS